MNTTDRDVIDRAAALLENARVYVLKKKEKRKQAFAIAITGYAAARAMKMFRPLMGVRRKQQIDDAIRRWDLRPVKRVEWSKSSKRADTKTL